MEVNAAKERAKEMIEAILPFVNDCVPDKETFVEQPGQKIGRAKQIAMLWAFELSSTVDRLTRMEKNLETEAAIEKCKKELDFIEEVKEEIENYKL